MHWPSPSCINQSIEEIFPCINQSIEEFFCLLLSFYCSRYSTPADTPTTWQTQVTSNSFFTTTLSVSFMLFICRASNEQVLSEFFLAYNVPLCLYFIWYLTGAYSVNRINSESNKTVERRFGMFNYREGMSCGDGETQHPQMVWSPGEWDDEDIQKYDRCCGCKRTKYWSIMSEKGWERRRTGVCDGEVYGHEQLESCCSHLHEEFPRNKHQRTWVDNLLFAVHQRKQNIATE